MDTSKQTAGPWGTYTQLALNFPANLTEIKEKQCFSTEDSTRVFLTGSFRPQVNSSVACRGWMWYTCSRCHVELLILPPSVQKLVVAARFLGHKGIYFGGREERKWANDWLVRKHCWSYLNKVLGWLENNCPWTKQRLHSALVGWNWTRVLSLIF